MPDQNFGELLHHVLEVSGPRGRLTVVDVEGTTAAEQARFLSLYRLARAAQQRPVLLLRAMVEEWDAARTVREVY